MAYVVQRRNYADDGMTVNSDRFFWFFTPSILTTPNEHQLSPHSIEAVQISW